MRCIKVGYYTERSLIKFNTTVTSQLPAGTSVIRLVNFVVFMEQYFTHIRKTL
jgi:hypothetical protein